MLCSTFCAPSPHAQSSSRITHSCKFSSHLDCCGRKWPFCCAEMRLAQDGVCMCWYQHSSLCAVGTDTCRYSKKKPQKQHSSPSALTWWITRWKLCMIRDKLGRWKCVCVWRKQKEKERRPNLGKIRFDCARSRLSYWNSEKEGPEEQRLCSKAKFGVQWLLQSGLISKKRAHTHPVNRWARHGEA